MTRETRRAVAGEGSEPLLRPGLLAGRVLAVAVAPGTGGSPEAREGARRCAALGAALTAHGAIDVLLNDALGAFDAALGADGDGAHALRASLDGTWNATRAVASSAFIPDARGGKVINLAPAASAGAHPGCEAARAGLENMARTLSIEWSRYGIRTTAILPGAASTPAAVAGLVAFLASPAGDYFSGCRLELGSTAKPPLGAKP
jgi:citronellol/citronellal dehydrogenase